MTGRLKAKPHECPEGRQGYPDAMFLLVREEVKPLQDNGVVPKNLKILSCSYNDDTSKRYLTIPNILVLRHPQNGI